MSKQVKGSSKRHSRVRSVQAGTAASSSCTHSFALEGKRQVSKQVRGSRKRSG